MLAGTTPFLPMKNLRCLLVLAALATAAVAQETPVDPAKLALAREVIAVMKADRMFDAMAAQMKQMAAQMAPQSPDMTPEQRKRTEDLNAKIMDLSMSTAKEMLTKMDQIYADVYSEAELKAMKAFFSSPEGQSMLQKQPQIMQHVMPLVKGMQQTLIPKIQQLVEESKAPAPAAAPAAK